MADQSLQVTASFSYTAHSAQQRTIRDIIERMDAHAEMQRAVELKTLSQSQITTILELERFLSPKAYKRADGSPLLDLTF